MKVQQFKTCGGVSDEPDLQPFEQKIMAICDIEMLGLKSAFDCDSKRPQGKYF